MLFSASVVDVQLPGGSSPNITVQLQTSGTAAAIAKGSLSGNGKQANTQDGAVPQQSDSFSMTCNLLIGADGAGSAVRRSLEKAQPGKGWEVKQYPCRSAQLLWKVRWLYSPWWLSLVLGLFPLKGWPISVRTQAGCTVQPVEQHLTLLCAFIDQRAVARSNCIAYSVCTIGGDRRKN